MVGIREPLRIAWVIVVETTGSAGQVLAGRYRLVALLGRGGMGCVWRAEHLSLGTPVAIKLISPSVATRAGMLRRFALEAQAAARLRSVNVVQILDHGVDDGVPYIAMECLEGESLGQRLDREHKLDPSGTALIMTGVCRALARAHRLGILHRDLKPDNLFIARDEAGPVVKVLDFGIAKMVEPGAPDPTERPETANRTETGTMLGTPCYMSPEQARRHMTVDARSDLWALAVIAFECLTGRRPFDAGVIGELMMQICSEPIPRPSSVGEVPQGFDAWFERATRRDPAARFQTVRELADALADVLTPGQRWLDALGEGDVTASAGPAVDPCGDTVAAEVVDAGDVRVSQTGSPSVLSKSPATPRRRRPVVVAITACVVVAGAALGLRASYVPQPSGALSEPTGAAAAPASHGEAPSSNAGPPVAPSSAESAASSVPVATAAPSSMPVATAAPSSVPVVTAAPSSKAATPVPPSSTRGTPVAASSATAAPGLSAAPHPVAPALSAVSGTGTLKVSTTAPSATATVHAKASAAATAKPPDDDLMSDHR